MVDTVLTLVPVIDLFDDPPCADQAELFFSYDAGDQAEAKALCASCPKIAACEVDSKDAPFGIWAGKTEVERGFRGGHRMSGAVTRVTDNVDAIRAWFTKHPGATISTSDFGEIFPGRSRSSMRKAMIRMAEADELERWRPEGSTAYHYRARALVGAE